MEYNCSKLITVYNTPKNFIASLLSLTGPSKLSLNLFKLKDETETHSVLNLLSEIFRIVGTELTPAMYNLLEDGLNDMISCSNPTCEEFMN